MEIYDNMILYSLEIQKSQIHSPDQLRSHRKFHGSGICQVSPSSDPMSTNHQKTIQCGRNPKQEWRPPILHRPTSLNGITTYPIALFPNQLRRKQSNSRIPVVHSSTTTH